MTTDSQTNTFTADNSNVFTVKMQLKSNTMDRIEHLKELTGVASETNIVSGSIRFTEEIIQKMKELNAKLYIESPDGSKLEIDLSI